MTLKSCGSNPSTFFTLCRVTYFPFPPCSLTLSENFTFMTGILIIYCFHTKSSDPEFHYIDRFYFKAKHFKTIKILSYRLEYAVFVQINYSFELLLFKLICHSNIYLLHWQNVNSMFNSYLRNKRK